MRPAVGAMLGLDLGGVPGAQLLRVLPQIGSVTQPRRGRDPVRLVPSGWICLEGCGEPWQFFLQPMAGLPAEELAGASGVEGVVIVGHGDHERLDEGLLASVDQVRNDGLQLVLRPGPGRGHDLWQTQRRPVVLAVEEAAELVLERLVADCIGFTDQDLGVGRQCGAAVDRTAEGIEHVGPVEHGLTDERVAGIEVALKVPLVDPRHLLRHCGHGRVLVIDAGQPQDGIGDLPVLRADHLFGRGLRPGVGPARIDRLSFVDPLAGTARGMHQHRARIHELFDLEPLQRAQQAAGALDRDGLIERVIVTGKIEIGDEVDDAGDA